ncbi:ABC transporter permease [Demequina mangrovi]|uniref:NitT/TauT family transport system permease protein n=1 Tax=Demequina mangrovi TaxID=1043493 RepID=A0A1H6W609_9MICO|nr:ABC transporter permease subunit [Demequina mangrovi]SEJ12343.1 NitT/TauT family transport system permease protein [Demequina mangrovi]
MRGDRIRGVLWGLAGVLAAMALWEGYKALAPADGIVIGELTVLPRTTDIAMPHIWDMVARLFDPVTRAAGADVLWWAVLQAAAFSLGIAALGWLIGVVSGMVLALLMQRWLTAESAVLPWVVLSQTVPLIAIAPLVKRWGTAIHIGSFEWENWMSVAVIASYLAFFPVAVSALRGLKSPHAADVDLFRAYAAGWWTGIVRLRLPSAVPYLLPALRLAAANAVVGTIVAEVSIGLGGGVGRMIIEFAATASGDPAKTWAPIFGAMLIGLVSAGLVSLIGLGLGRFRRGEAPA